MSRYRRTFFAIALIAGILPSARVLAQCADWRASTGLHWIGWNYAMTTWDPDGPGPQPALLVVAGSFDRAGGINGTPVSSIATFNGSTWQSLGSGITGSVYALTVHNNELVAAGYFTSAGGVPANNIARWDGTAWHALGGGITGGSIQTVASYHGDLYAGGGFSMADGLPAASIARWNGSTWQPMGPGADFVVLSMRVFRDELIVGGGFSHIGGIAAEEIARWNGTQWNTLSTGISCNFCTLYVYSMTEYNNDLIAGGLFSSAGGTPAKMIARWDGAEWHALGEGFDAVSVPVVYALETFNGQLYAGGEIDNSGPLQTSKIARWDGTKWNAMSTGVTSRVETLAVFNGMLYVGGYPGLAGGQPYDSLARWTGTAWQSMPGVLTTPDPSATVFALSPWSGRVVIGGYFGASIHESPGYAYGLLAWNGIDYSPLGDADGPVYAAASSPGGFPGSSDLIVGGGFDNLDYTPFNHIARRNDITGINWEPMGNGFNDDVYAITRFNGSIYAAGAFTFSGPVPMNHIGRWNGTNWVGVGPATTLGCNGIVNAMKAWSSGTSLHLVVGGDFTSSGGVATTRIASYNASTIQPQTSWTALGAGFNGSVYAIERFNGSTYAAGSFTASGATALNHIARWDGTAWRPLGAGVNGTVLSLTVSNNTLVVGGAFTSAGGNPAANLARWDGTNWTTLGAGTDATVRALTTFHNEIQAGGDFLKVRNGVLESPRWARFSETGAPWIAQQPSSLGDVCATPTVSFHMFPASGYGGLEYQWRKNGTAINNGPTGTGSTIGTNGVSFNIFNPGPADSGSYDCILSNACGSDTSAAASVTIFASGSGDGDANGLIDGRDIAGFNAAIISAGPASAAYCVYDMNHDGTVNAADKAILIAQLLGH